MRVREPFRSLCLGLVLLSGSVAHAETAEGETTPPAASAQTLPAAERFAEARRLFLAEDCRGALPMFESVYEETKSSNALLYVARCQRALGKWDASYESYRATVARAEEQAAGDPKYETTRDAARSELDQVTGRVALVTVVLTSDVTGAKIRVGERELRPEEVGTPIAVMPGSVHVEANAPNGKPQQRDVSVGAGASRTVAFSLDGAPPTDQGPSTSTDDDKRTYRYIGIGSAVVGAAGIATLAVFGSLSKSRFDDLSDECGDEPCPASKQSDIDEGRTYQTVANVGLVVGAVGLTAGATFLILGWPSDEGSGVALHAGPNQLRVSGAF